MKLAFIIDPINLLDPSHDTSVALIEAAQILGHEVWITCASQLTVINSKAWATLQQIELKPAELVEGRYLIDDPWYKLGNSSTVCLETMDAVFMRTDPPVDDAYLFATYILDYIDPHKTLVVNSTNGIRAANEKMYALQFTDAIPETIVSAQAEIIQQFVEKKGAGILKPLGNKAGEGILFLQPGDRNFNSMLELSTQRGKVPVMVQAYLKEAKKGDKRIILLNGEPIGALNRLSAAGEFRNNMAAGGTVAACEITDREHEICEQLAPTLRRDGLIFVGIDVIGGYLTEVNVTSPTGIREIDKFNHDNLGKRTIEWIEQARNQKLE
ncbi:MAG: glutathione synthase [Cyanobacteria bacterium P01_A01_bin.45]